MEIFISKISLNNRRLLHFGFLLFVLLFSFEAVADRVSIRAKDVDGVGKIIFTWPTPVPFVARLSGRQLIIQFSRPIESSYTSAVKTLKKYIGMPSLQDNGKTLTFPLLGDFSHNYYSSGRTVIVEVIREELQYKITNKISTKRDKIKNVAIRIGAYPSYNRIVFDWRKKVPYSLEKKKNLLKMVFRAKANIELRPINQKNLRNIKGAISLIKESETIVGLSIPSTSNFKHFRSGSKIVVDVSNPTDLNDAPPIKALSSLIFDSKQISNNRESSFTSKQAAITNSQIRRPQISNTFVSSIDNIQGQFRLAQNIQKTKDQTTVSPSVKKSKITKGSNKAAPNSKKKENKLKQKLLKDVACAPTPKPKKKITADDIKNISLRVDWPGPVAAAVFRRAGNLWMVFDKAQKVDICKLKDQGGLALKSITQDPSDTSTILRLVTVEGVNPTIRRDGFAWIFDFKKQLMKPETPINLSTKLTKTGPRLLATIRDAGEPIYFKDTKVYDNLFVIPVITLATGIIRNYQYPQLNILESAQGIVIKPNIDDLTIRSKQQNVEIFSPSRLALSTKGMAKAKGKTIQALSRIFTIRTWRSIRRQKPGEFYFTKRKILDRLSRVKGPEKDKARMDLAIFLFGNGYSYEANGVLKVIKAKNPDIDLTGKYRLLSGATNFMIGRNTEALKMLMHPSMGDTDEGNFWRAAAKLTAGEDIENSAKFLSKKGNIFNAYPRPVKVKLGILAVEADIAVGDVNSGIKHLGSLAKESLQPQEIDQLALVEGRLKKQAGDFKGAVKAWQAVEKGTHFPSIAESIIERTDLLLDLKKMKPETAIRELEKLRYIWRGGNFEFNLLSRLGILYNQVGKYRKGLRTLRSAVSNFSGRKEVATLTQEMESAFIELYLNDEADKLAPIRALALFEEFKELTPSGAEGDEMIRKLASRLTKVDLLGQASKLLLQQVEFRLKGNEKARVGGQLANVYVLNKEPEKAVDILAKTKVGSASNSQQRRYINSRALIELKRFKDALTPLENDESREADLMRTEIYWGRDWPKAANSLQRLLKTSGAGPGRKLDERQAQLVLNYGVALAYSGNNRGITRLNKDYLKEMDTTPFKDAFRLIASPDSIGLIDYRTISSRVKLVSNFKNFMVSYRKRLKQNKLSLAN